MGASAERRARGLPFLEGFLEAGGEVVAGFGPEAFFLDGEGFVEVAREVEQATDVVADGGDVAGVGGRGGSSTQSAVRRVSESCVMRHPSAPRSSSRASIPQCCSRPSR